MGGEGEREREKGGKRKVEKGREGERRGRVRVHVCLHKLPVVSHTHTRCRFVSLSYLRHIYLIM